MLGSSYEPSSWGKEHFQGDPPPDPRFLASLGALSRVNVHQHCLVRATNWMMHCVHWKTDNLAPNLCNSTCRVRPTKGSSTSDSAPSEASKRGYGGGSPRKCDDFTGRQFSSLTRSSAFTQLCISYANARATHDHCSASLSLTCVIRDTRGPEQSESRGAWLGNGTPQVE